jgi:hypothetical protein
VVEWLRARGGKAGITLRKLGAELGFSAPRVHRAIQHLATTGILRADLSSRGTVLELVCPPAVSPPVAATDAADAPVASVIEWLRRRGGKAEVSMRKLGADPCCSGAKAHKDVRGLADLGILKVVPGKRSSLLEITRPVPQLS